MSQSHSVNNNINEQRREVSNNITFSIQSSITNNINPKQISQRKIGGIKKLNKNTKLSSPSSSIPSTHILLSQQQLLQQNLTQSSTFNINHNQNQQQHPKQQQQQQQILSSSSLIQRKSKKNNILQHLYQQQQNNIIEFKQQHLSQQQQQISISNNNNNNIKIQQKSINQYQQHLSLGQQFQLKSLSYQSSSSSQYQQYSLSSNTKHTNGIIQQQSDGYNNNRNNFIGEIVMSNPKQSFSSCQVESLKSQYTNSLNKKQQSKSKLSQQHISKTYTQGKQQQQKKLQRNNISVNFNSNNTKITTHHYHKINNFYTQSQKSPSQLNNKNNKIIIQLQHEVKGMNQKFLQINNKLNLVVGLLSQQRDKNKMLQEENRRLKQESKQGIKQIQSDNSQQKQKRKMLNSLNNNKVEQQQQKQQQVNKKQIQHIKNNIKTNLVTTNQKYTNKKQHKQQQQNENNKKKHYQSQFLHIENNEKQKIQQLKQQYTNQNNQLQQHDLDKDQLLTQEQSQKIIDQHDNNWKKSWIVSQISQFYYQHNNDGQNDKNSNSNMFKNNIVGSRNQNNQLKSKSSIFWIGNNNQDPDDKDEFQDLNENNLSNQQQSSMINKDNNNNIVEINQNPKMSIWNILNFDKQKIKNTHKNNDSKLQQQPITNPQFNIQQTIYQSSSLLQPIQPRQISDQIINQSSCGCFTNVKNILKKSP